MNYCSTIWLMQKLVLVFLFLYNSGIVKSLNFQAKLKKLILLKNKYEYRLLLTKIFALLYAGYLFNNKQ